MKTDRIFKFKQNLFSKVIWSNTFIFIHCNDDVWNNTYIAQYWYLIWLDVSRIDERRYKYGGVHRNTSKQDEHIQHWTGHLNWSEKVFKIFERKEEILLLYILVIGMEFMERFHFVSESTTQIIFPFWYFVKLPLVPLFAMLTFYFCTWYLEEEK